MSSWSNTGKRYTGKQINKNRYAGVIDVMTSQELPDKFTLQLDIKKIGEVTGDWNFDIPVSKNKTASATRVFYPSAGKTDNGVTLTVKKVAFAPNATEISLELTEPLSVQEIQEAGSGAGREQNSYRFEILDDQGRKLAANVAGGVETQDGVRITRYKAVATTSYQGKPAYLTVQPVLEKVFWVTADLGNLPIILEVGSHQQLTITQVEFRPDKTLLHFKGVDPYNTLNIRDLSGREYSFDYKKPPGKDKENAFVREYPPLDRNQKLTVETVKHEEPVELKNLKVKVPLNW